MFSIALTTKRVKHQTETDIHEEAKSKNSKLKMNGDT